VICVDGENPINRKAIDFTTCFGQTEAACIPICLTLVRGNPVVAYNNEHFYGMASETFSLARLPGPDAVVAGDILFIGDANHQGFLERCRFYYVCAKEHNQDVVAKEFLQVYANEFMETAPSSDCLCHISNICGSWIDSTMSLWPFSWISYRKVKLA